jgi:phosphopantetheinyl transferase
VSNFVIDSLAEGNFFQQSVNRDISLAHQSPDKTTFLRVLTGFKLYFHAMPLIHVQHNTSCRLGLWQIAEEVLFFEEQIPYRSEASNQARKLQQLASRMVLNELESGFPFDGVVLNHAGKPMLVSKNTYFSISHTSGYAAAIIADIAVGLDVEIINDRVLKVVHKFLNAHEISLLSELDTLQRIKYATLFWSIKEAVFKCWGKGGVDFSDHIRIVSFQQTDKGSASILFNLADGQSFTVEYMLIENLWVTYIMASL